LPVNVATQGGLKARVKCIHADIRRMDAVAHGGFDIVVACGTVVSDCGDPAAALRQFTRAPRPGGKACVSLRTPRCLNTTKEQDSTPAEPGMVRGHRAFDWHLFDRPSARRAFAEAGLPLLRVVPVGCEPMPQSKRRGDMEVYVRTHLYLTDDTRALPN